MPDNSDILAHFGGGGGGGGVCVGGGVVGGGGGGRGSLSYIEITRVVGQVLHPFPLFALYIKHTQSR